MLIAVRIVIRPVNPGDSVQFCFRNTVILHAGCITDLQQLIQHAVIPGIAAELLHDQGAAHGHLHAAAEEGLRILQRKIMAMSRLFKSPVDRISQIRHRIQHGAIHIKNCCIITHICHIPPAVSGRLPAQQLFPPFLCLSYDCWLYHSTKIRQ